MSQSITFEGVKAAAGRLKGQAVRTPLLECQSLNERLDARILLKAETFQHFGSFKFRGAYNLVSQLSPAEKEAGVIAWSSGNHAQGVAFAAKLFGVKAKIVMPADAPAVKIANVKKLGAEIVFYDRYKDDREAIAREIQADEGSVLAPSYDHPHIIEGQGTVALEVFEDASALGLRLDAMAICCGGGGLTAGCATFLRYASPDTEIWIAEPVGFDETWASIRAGERLRADISAPTLCDALASPSPGELTFPILKERVTAGASVSDDEVMAAVRYSATEMKLVVEPGGAAVLAGLLHGKYDIRGKTVAITLSGGNVDPGLLAAALGPSSR